MTHDPAAVRRSHRLRDAALYLGRPVAEIRDAAIDVYLDGLTDSNPGLAAALDAAEQRRERSARWGGRLRLVPDGTPQTGWPT